MNIYESKKIQSIEELQTLFKKLGLVKSDENESESKTQNSYRHGIFIKKKIKFPARNNLLSQLKQLIINCELTQVPIELFKLKYLTSLNLSNNNLENLPNEIGNLINLVKLELSGNKLNCLPKTLKQIQLNFLDISRNKFSEVPDVIIYSLRNLTVLDLSSNQINIFDTPSCVSKLIVLDLSNNSLKHLPNWIFSSLCQLKILNVSNNEMCICHESIHAYGHGIYDSLQVLNIENCGYNSANIQVFCHFKNLELLQFGNKTCEGKIGCRKNFFGNFSINKFQNIQNIKYLYLQNVQIGTLPSDFDLLKNIIILDLSNNLLSWLPDSFCSLTFLRIVYLTSNQLLFLPANIGKLVNLQQIHLANNKLEEIPQSFYLLPNLEFVDFYNNNISSFDEKILEKISMKGIDLELNYLNPNYSGYESLRSSFRKYFDLLNCRHNSQKSNVKPFDEVCVATETCDSKCSTASFESDRNSDIEDSSANFVKSSKIVSEDEDWEKNLVEFNEDDLFDPNEISDRPRCRNFWWKKFQMNYCPASCHMPSLMPTYKTCLKLPLKKETVEEGQFDSD